VTCGDIVVLDDEGYLHIVDRKKDLIISGGVNIYPREVEEVLATHEAVAEVAVVGVPDEAYGERVVAHLVLRSGVEFDQDTRAALEEHCRAKLAGFKVPREMHALAALPRNAAGKVLKRDLRAV
jgi:acyl-CoA synthetase (AMP-forming)/AMP-acid ligase II